LDFFKGRLEAFIRNQVGSLKRMGAQLEDRLMTVNNQLQKVGGRYQETTTFLNTTQQELEEKTYITTYTDQLVTLNRQEELLRKKLEDIQVQKDRVSIQMRSATINKKLEFENSGRVVNQLKEDLGFLKSEKSELDVQSELIQQQVEKYTEMKRSLENVKLNDLKSTINIFQPSKRVADHSNNDESWRIPGSNVQCGILQSQEGRKSYKFNSELSPVERKFDGKEVSPQLKLGNCEFDLLPKFISAEPQVTKPTREKGESEEDMKLLFLK